MGGSQNQLSDSHICFFSIFNSISPSNESWYGLGCAEKQRIKPEKMTAACRYQYKETPVDNLPPFLTSRSFPVSLPWSLILLQICSFFFCQGIVQQNKMWDKIYSELNENHYCSLKNHCEEEKKNRHWTDAKERMVVTWEFVSALKSFQWHFLMSWKNRRNRA